MADAVETSQFSKVDENVGLAFGLVVCAGLSTAIGAAAVYANCLVQLASKSVLAVALGFSAGVMLYVSFVEIFVKSVGAFTDYGHSEKNASSCATLCFFSGVLLMKLLGIVVHKFDGTHDCCTEFPEIRGLHGEEVEANQATANHEGHGDGHGDCCGGHSHGDVHGHGHGHGHNTSAVVDLDTVEVQPKPAPLEAKTPVTDKDAALKRMGLNTALAIALHNLPEGLATFVATLADPVVGITLAIAIAIHNIPEGLCVAMPIYYATHNRHLAFMWALLSGLSEPIGALIGYAIIKSTGDDMNQLVYGALFGLVGGMMVAIVIYELLPTGQRYDPEGKYLAHSVVVGMFVMAASLVLFQY